MRYAVLIDRAEDNSFGVVVPDLPGCTSAGATIDAAVANAREAMRLWLDAAIEAGSAAPKARSIEDLSRDQEVAAALADGALLALVQPEPTAELAA